MFEIQYILKLIIYIYIYIYLGYLALRITFCPYFLHAWPSSVRAVESSVLEWELFLQVIKFNFRVIGMK